MAEVYIEEREYRENVKKLKLNNKEKERARELLERLERGQIDSPKDFLTDWEEIKFKKPEEPEEVKRFVGLDKIKGSPDSERLVPKRLRKKLQDLLNDDWIRHENFDGPHLTKKPGEDVYCIGIDGHHRVMAFKALGIGKIWARVEFQ